MEELKCSKCGTSFPVRERMKGSLRCKKCRNEEIKAYRLRMCGKTDPQRKWTGGWPP